MIRLHHTSGVSDPVPLNQGFLYASINGVPSVKHSDNSIGLLQLDTLGVSGLIDVSGIWTSGNTLGWNGSVFVPTPVVGGTGAVTYASSGNFVEVRVLLASGMFAPGTSGDVTWSGIDQGYDTLEVLGEVEGVNIATIYMTNMYFNGDFTNTNYNSRRVQSLTESNQTYAQDEPYVGIGSGPTNGAGNYRSPMWKIIPQYASTLSRKWAYDLGFGTYNYLGASQGLDSDNMQWENAAAINMITIRANGIANSATSGTILYLYGVKKQSVNVSGSFGPANIANGLIIP